MKNKFFIPAASFIFLIIILFAIIGVRSSLRGQTDSEEKFSRLQEVRAKQKENSLEYQKISPLAAKSRAECALMASREGQMKYLNAQNNNLRDEERQLVHDLKISGISDPLARLQK